MSIASLAKQLGVPRQTVSDWLAKGMPRDMGSDQDRWIASHNLTARNRPKGALAGMSGDEDMQDLLKEKIRQEIRYRDLKCIEQITKQRKVDGELIEVKDAVSVYGSLIGMANSNLRSVPRSICDRLLYLENPQDAERIVLDAIEAAIEPLYSQPRDDRFPSIPKTENGTRKTVQRTGKAKSKSVGRKTSRSH